MSLGTGILILAALLHGPLVGGSGAATRASGSFAGMVHLLGGFRPLAVDLLWLRADALFRAGRLWELAALFEAITALDPDNRLVREFASWHLAYNVALAEPDPDRRFAWFERGVGILEAGRPYPEGSAATRTFAGRMFLDRLDAGILDDFEARVRERYGAGPLEIALAWFEEATAEAGAPATAHVHLLACLSRLRDAALDAGRVAEARSWEAGRRRALAQARLRHPEEDWSFADEAGSE